MPQAAAFVLEALANLGAEGRAALALVLDGHALRIEDVALADVRAAAVVAVAEVGADAAVVGARHREVAGRLLLDDDAVVLRLRRGAKRTGAQQQGDGFETQ